MWQPVPDWDGTRDEAILILVIFGKHLYVAFFMVAFIISFHGDHVGWQGDFNVAVYSLIEQCQIMFCSPLL